MFKMKSKQAIPLAKIAQLRDPRDRANALLNIRSADIYNPLFVALLHSVDTPEAGDAARNLANDRAEMLSNPAWTEYWSWLGLVTTRPASLLPAKENLAKLQYFWSFTDYDTLARALLDFGRWTEVGFDEIVRRATLGRTPACWLLQAQALVCGILQYIEPHPITLTRSGDRSYYRIESLPELQKNGRTVH